MVDIEPLTHLVSSKEMCTLAGITYRQITYWTDRGAIVPDEPSQGSGTKALWRIERVQPVRFVGAVAGLQGGGGRPQGADRHSSRAPMPTGKLRRVWDQLLAMPELLSESVLFVERSSGLIDTEPTTGYCITRGDWADHE